MKEYRFYVYFYNDNEAFDSAFLSVFAKNYCSAYKQLLVEIPLNFSYESFRVSPNYRVNGKERIAK